MAFIIIIVIVLIAIVVIYDSSQSQKAKTLADAEQVYLQSLSDLKSNPVDADLKQHTLALGRKYSNLTRENTGSTIFDEVALMNDINAACAAATAPAKFAASGDSIEARLHTLTALKNKGLIDLSEYEKRRAEILKSI